MEKITKGVAKEIKNLSRDVSDYMTVEINTWNMYDENGKLMR